MPTKDHSTDVTKFEGAPAGLAKYATKQNEEMTRAMKAKRVLSRLKRIQGMTDDSLKAKHGEGSVILHPTGVKIADRDEDFAFVPLFFFLEYTKDSDLEDSEADFILERSFDTASNIAILAQDKERRTEDYADGRKRKDGTPMRYRYVEHFVFPGVLYGGPNNMTPCVISFERGEHFQGQNLCSAWDMRKIGMDNAPMWACVWNFRSVLRTRDTFKWFGWDFDNPEKMYIEEGEYETFHSMHEELARLHAERLLVVDRTDTEEDIAAATASVANDEAM